jgi:hypothetical protein
MVEVVGETDKIHFNLARWLATIHLFVPDYRDINRDMMIISIIFCREK